MNCFPSSSNKGWTFSLWEFLQNICTLLAKLLFIASLIWLEINIIFQYVYKSTKRSITNAVDNVLNDQQIYTEKIRLFPLNFNAQ